MLISRLKRNSPLFGLVRLTARHVWLPLCPLRVALPVRLKVFSHSSNESPLEASAPGSVPPVKQKKHYDCKLTWVYPKMLSLYRKTLIKTLQFLCPGQAVSHVIQASISTVFITTVKHNVLHPCSSSVPLHSITKQHSVLLL